MNDQIQQSSELDTSSNIVAFAVPGQEGVHYQGTAALFEDQLWHVHQHERSWFSVQMAYRTVLKSPLAANPNSSSLWYSDRKIDDGKLSEEIRTDNRPSVLATSTRLFLFWTNAQQSDRLYATRRNAGQEGNFWTREQLLQDQFGANLQSNGHKDAPFHVIAVTDETLLLTVIRDGNTLEYHYFYDADFDPAAKIWKARASRSYAATTIQKLLGNQDPGFRLNAFTSIASFSHGALPENDGEYGAAPGSGYIEQCLCYRTDKLAWACAALTAPIAAPPQLPDLDARSAAAQQFGANIQRVFMIADPGGRVVGYFQDRGKERENCLMTMTRSTNTNAGAGVWSTPELLGGVSIKTAMTPCAQYVYGPLQATTIAAADGRQLEVVYRDVREYVFYGTDDYESYNYRERVAYRHYGRVERVANEQVENFTQASAAQRDGNGLFFVQGFIDGPPPLPQQNLDANPGGGVAGLTHYGTLEKQSTTATNRQGFKWGIRTEGAVTAMGAGPAWDISMSHTIASGFGVTEEVELSTNAEVHSSVVNNRVQPVGAVFGRGITLTADKFYFRDAAGQRVTNAPEVSVVQARWNNAISRPFTTATSVPGDLESYRVEAWNERMRPIYKKLYGVDVNYIQDIVERYALVISTKGQQKNYLSTSWHVAGGVSEGLATTVSEFREESYRFDAAVWAGIKVDFDGFIEATVMAGVEFSLETTHNTINSGGFSIDTRVEVPDPGDKPGVTVYDYRLYFMPPPTNGTPYNWTDELLESLAAYPDKNKSLDGAVDPGSKCWKIMYVVTYIQYATTVARLVDFGLPKDIADDLAARGIHGTTRLIAELGLAHDAELARLAPATDPREESIRAALRKWNRACV
jgi:hypothetical protein